MISIAACSCAKLMPLFIFINITRCHKGNKPYFILFKNIKIQLKHNTLILLHLMSE